MRAPSLTVSGRHRADRFPPAGRTHDRFPIQYLALPEGPPLVIKGMYASAIGAILGGCRYFFGYPITPSTEGAELMAALLPRLDGIFVQAVSEVAAINMMYGAGAAGVRATTFTSSPGFSLMLEGISYMIGADLPGVVFNVMRGGPGLGNIAPEQSDIKLACRGLGHGNTHAIVLAPATPQEMLDLTMVAFDLSFMYRNPVIVLADGYLAQMTGKVSLPETMVKPGLPQWAVAGDATHRRNLVTSIFLNETDLEARNLRLLEKYETITAAEQRAETFWCDDADVLLIACNTPSRMAKGAVSALRARGIRAGLFRPITLWPFPIADLTPLLRRARRVMVIEASDRQLEDEVRLAISRADIQGTPAIERLNRPRWHPAFSRRDRRTRGCMNTFYDTFERHAHGEGLKGHSTHYCPGCGHGLVHKYLAEAVDELGIQDRTVAISPVGCAVFLYCYLDVGNIQAAHGRAPAVAIGQKVAHPESIVVSYQGDGDLASIGLAEIMQAAQMGIPITVIFVNNAIYGMTGGQMAPTTLMGQRTATTPDGRGRFMGEPLRIAELMAQLDGPVFVQRVALYDNKQRVVAKKAIKKGLQLQAENRGFALVEVLSECPLHLGRTPEDAERWVKEEMTQVFPLGVKKDVTATRDAWPEWRPPTFDPAIVRETIGGTSEPAPRFCRAFPRELFGDDVGLKLAGAGGDGAQTAAMIIARAAINEGFDATHIPSYGPESRGGTSYADVRIAEEAVLSPAAPQPHVLLAFNAPSLAKFAPLVADGGVVIYDASVIADAPHPPFARMVPVPATQIAADLGMPMVKNIVALGALAEATQLLPLETFLTAIRQTLHRKPQLVELNERAFAAGVRAAAESQRSGERRCPEAQGDGVPCVTVNGACDECARAI